MNFNSDIITYTQEDNNLSSISGFDTTGQTGYIRNNRPSNSGTTVTIPKQVTVDNLYLILYSLKILYK